MLIEMNMIRATILERATFKPWFLKDEDTTISTVANTEYVALPSDFLGFDYEDEWSGVAYNDTDDSSADPWVDIVLDDFNTIRNFYKDLTGTDAASSETTGKPEKGGLVGSRLYMRPIPDAIYNLRFRFFAGTAAFADDSAANDWLTYAPDWVMGEVGHVLAAQYTKNDEDAVYFDKMRERGRLRCYRETIARQEAGKTRNMGDD